jgi:hypothetical protein
MIGMGYFIWHSKKRHNFQKYRATLNVSNLNGSMEFAHPDTMTVTDISTLRMGLWNVVESFIRIKEWRLLGCYTV